MRKRKKNSEIALLEKPTTSNSSKPITGMDNKTYTWSYDYFAIFCIYQYLIFKYFKELADDHLEIFNDESKSLKLPDGTNVSILLKGSVIFSVKKKLIVADVDYRYLSIRSNFDISDMVEEINDYVYYNNPWRGKNIKLTGHEDSSQLMAIGVDNISIDDIILDTEIKNDIMDNTVFQLTHMSGSNGLILYGVPGVGKSLMCSVIANEANKHGITTITITHEPDYKGLVEIIETLFDKCIIFLEDIDSMAESRLEGNRYGRISELLQFINGIGSLKSDVIFVATTNYLELLDNAIKNRPVRFNRIIEIKMPSYDELIQLFELYFGKDKALLDIYEPYCSQTDKLKLTGSHIKEIRRTAELLYRKRYGKNSKIDFSKVLKESIEIVIKSFTTTISTLGF